MLHHRRAMELENHITKAVNVLRSRICDPKFIFSNDSPDSNYSKLKFMISSSVTEACNNSILLLGPRGSGKNAVLELVIQDLLQQYPESISVIRLNGLLHSDDISAFKEIARQLCMEHQLLFSKAASFDDNSQFMVAMLKECGLAHKTVIFVLDEFDLFAQGKQRLLYSLLDAMQSITSQAVVVGISCRLDADQLLEKRVRSRFSHRKLLFLPPSMEDSQRLLVHMLTLPIDSSFPHDYAVEFNKHVQNIVEDRRFKETLNKYLNIDSSVKDLLRFLFCAVSHMDLQTGFLSRENFEIAFLSIQRHPKLEFLRKYKSVHDSFQTSRNACLRAFEHLIHRELICFTDNRGQSLSVEFRPVKLLISPEELHQGIGANNSCPPKLKRFMDREGII